MISVGTERLVALGQVPAQAHDAMRVPYMDGAFSFPIKYGYSLVGHDGDGRALHCLHPHESTAWVDASGVVELPASAPLDRMAMTSNLETALNATWDAKVRTGSTAVICGFGTLGALLALTLRLRYDAEAVIVERDTYRASLARSLGFETVGDMNVPEQFPLLFNTSGTQSGLQWCLDHAAFESQIIELGWYGAKPVSVSLGGAFHFNRVRLISSQVGHVAASRRGELSRHDRRAEAVDLLTDDAFDDLPRTRIPFGEAPEFFDTLRDGTLPKGLVWIIDYGA